MVNHFPIYMIFHWIWDNLISQCLKSITILLNPSTPYICNVTFQNVNIKHQISLSIFNIFNACISEMWGNVLQMGTIIVFFQPSWNKLLFYTIVQYIGKKIHRLTIGLFQWLGTIQVKQDALVISLILSGLQLLSKSLVFPQFTNKQTNRQTHKRGSGDLFPDIVSSIVSYWS